MEQPLLLLKGLGCGVQVQKMMQKNVENSDCSADLQLSHSLCLTPFLCWRKMNEAHLFFLGSDE